MYIYVENKITRVPEEVMTTTWLIKSEQKVEILNNFLLTNQVLPSPNIQHPLRTKDERYALLLTEFQNIAHIASLTNESTENVRSELTSIFNGL